MPKVIKLYGVIQSLDGTCIIFKAENKPSLVAEFVPFIGDCVKIKYGSIARDVKKMKKIDPAVEMDSIITGTRVCIFCKVRKNYGGVSITLIADGLLSCPLR
jgi:hypothetical protein